MKDEVWRRLDPLMPALATQNDLDVLWKHWRTLFPPYHHAQADDTFPQIALPYSKPHRHYHTVQHLVECLSEPIDEVAYNPYDVMLALFFHDIVYDPKAAPGSNEELSAQALITFASSSYKMPWWRSGTVADPANWVRLTAHARKPSEKPTVVDPHIKGGSWDASYLLDIDLAILGKPPERFWQYEDQVRKEYAFVPDEVYRPARARILQNFLDREHIYETMPMIAKYEDQARVNLRESIAKLTQA